MFYRMKMGGPYQYFLTASKNAIEMFFAGGSMMASGKCVIFQGFQIAFLHPLDLRTTGYISCTFVHATPLYMYTFNGIIRKFICVVYLIPLQLQHVMQ